MTTASKKRPRVLLLDGHSLAYRAFYALPPDLRTSSGQVTNAVYGFTGMLIKALQDHKTAYVSVAFDKGPPLERLAIRPEYKAQRTSAPDEFKQQLGLIREVLEVLKIPVFELANIEADDILYILGTKAAEEGHEVVIVTADRDYFQMVGPRIKLMMNRRGISDTVIYDPDAVHERFGFGPERYLDYAALRGDPSDNIEGVPGVGEKTAAKLIHTYGPLEEIFAHLDELTPKLKANLAEAEERVLVNREFFRFRGVSELAAQGADVSCFDITADDMQMGEWDFGDIRKLFDSLEFRVLYERLTADRPEAIEAGEGLEAKVVLVRDEEAVAKMVEAASGASSIAIRVSGDPSNFQSPGLAAAICTGGTAYVVGEEMDVPAVLAKVVNLAPLVTHGSKELIERLGASAISVDRIEMDTEIASYLVDPARGSYRLDELARQYLGKELRLQEAEPLHEAQGSLLDEPEPPDSDALGLEAVAINEMGPILLKELEQRGAASLFKELELPLARVLAKIESTGIKIDVGYLENMSVEMDSELRSIEGKIFDLAGEPFNIGSPPQLRHVLYEKLGLKPSKKTKTGFSTDASVLDSLREEHPIVDLILRHRERAKLKSTYLDALPPLVDPSTGRIHCRFNQTVATTGRLSSERPNLQNIPIRTEEGRQIRRAFIPDDGNQLVVADYSQIELRILAHLSQDEELVGAFRRGDDIHRLSIAKALGLDDSEVTPQLRSIGKMVSYGVTYGMGPFGLSQRLRIPVDQARTYIEGFFALYPGVRRFLDEVVEKATEDGFTTTILGRRRYVPELKSRNPRVRSLGERQALNAPIQGSAADIMKLAMVRVDEALGDGAARMVLTVHDELVLEAPDDEAAPTAELVRQAMESAAEFSVPLSADVAWGPNWAEAKS